jgi:Fe/S biogenesis protein NfuA
MDDAAPTTLDDAAETDTDNDAPVTKPVPLRVSDTALTQVMSILAAEDDPESLGLRVAVTGTNGVEYAYDLAFEERAEAADDDLIYNQGDLVVMVPADSVDSLWGATLDLPAAESQGGLVIRNPNRPDPMGSMDVELSGTVEERVNQLLTQQINPSLAAHGGFAKLESIIDSKAVVTMGGGCQGCAVSAMTLREGIQKSILQHVPEITEVVDATDHDAGENPFYTD